MILCTLDTIRKEGVGWRLIKIIFSVIIGNFISKLVSLPFLLIDDIRRFIIYLFKKKELSSDNKISRSKFLSISASLAYGLPITSLSYGILSNNVYDYRVKRRNISFKNLPKAFDGIKVCHISDIHIGSLKNRLAVRGGIDMILNEKPDIILFTGDLVNDRASELKGWGDDLSKIRAPSLPKVTAKCLAPIFSRSAFARFSNESCRL